MRPTDLFLRLVAAALLLVTTAAGAVDSPVKRIIPDGTDGDRSYYTVNCVSGERASIYVKHATEEVCAVARNGTPSCVKAGLLKDAAERACKPPPRG